ncbi:hypothetical protein B7P43_G17240 [Cryptotermes secundus]|uniref:Alpha 1,4-glycosyltransferase domain-containing protein n=1 Tax=Cryptotermes secundus TaxID=105785 RepID=A0A2J7RGF0_9NEOP|nr:hypothetical protein B7P43_G17240 [Cryptotermes secundus]
MKRIMRRYNITFCFVLTCALILITLWIMNEDAGGGNAGGLLYRVAAPILSLGGVGNMSDANGNGISCYDDEGSNTVDEISSSASPSPPRGKCIFFHETSCASSVHGEIVLTARQACAVESAAKMNPDLEVYLLFTSPIHLGNSTAKNKVLTQLLSYPNVHIRHLNFERYFMGSPLQEWYKGGALKASRWPRSHASDALRFLTLWKYGGTYLDLDVVVTRSLAGLSNFAGAESNTDVAAGVLNFGSEGLGQMMAEACLDNLRSEFRGDDWGNNGPGVITRVLKKLCKAQQVRDMTAERCHGFTVHPPAAFYPIPWRQWKLYFDEGTSAKTMARLKNSLAIHVWNKFSAARNITVGSRQPYGLIAQEFCPKVYSHCGPVF